MRFRLRQITHIYLKLYASFRYQQQGVFAVEYAVVLGMLAIILLGLFSESGSFSMMLKEVWDTTSAKIISQLS